MSKRLWICLVMMLVMQVAAPVGAQSAFFTENFESYAYLDSASWADWNIFDGRLELNKTSGWAINEPITLLLPDGTGYAAWKDYRGGEPNIYLQRLDAEGNRLWMEDVRVHEDVIAFVRGKMQLLPAPQGGVFVLFTDNRSLPDVPDSIDDHLFMQRISSSGQRLWQKDVLIALGASDPRYQRTYYTVLTPAGEVAVFWKTGYYYNTSQFFVQKYSPDGAPLWDKPLVVFSQEDVYAEAPRALASDPAGNLFLIWGSVIATDTPGRQYGVWVSSDGRLLTPAPLEFLHNRENERINDLRVVALADRSILFAWDTMETVWAQRMAADGSMLWPQPLRVNLSDLETDRWLHDVLLDGEGMLWLWWLNETLGVYEAQRLSPDGNRLLAQEQVIVPLGQNSGLLMGERSVRMNAALEVLDVYALNETSFFQPYLFAERYAPGGVRRSPSPRIVHALDGSVNQWGAHIAAGTDGSTLALWQQPRINRVDLFFQRYRPDGRPVQPDETVIDAGPVNELIYYERAELFTDLAAGPGGSAALAWEQAAGEQIEIRVLLLDGQGRPAWGEPQAVSPTLTAAQTRPTIGVDAGGNIYVAWLEGRGGLLIQKFTPDGQRAWGAGIPVAQRAIPQPRTLHQRDLPVLDVAPDGSVMVVWRQTELIDVPEGYQTMVDALFAQRFTAAGTPVWKSDHIVNLTDVGTITDLQMDFAPNGSAFVLWLTPADESDIVHIQLLDAAGNPTWAQETAIQHGYTALAAAPDNTAILSGLRGTTVWAHKISAEGKPVWNNYMRVSEKEYTWPQAPVVAVDTAGRSSIVWLHHNDAGNDTLYMNRIDANGKRLLSDTPLIAARRYYQPAGEARSRNILPSGQTAQTARLSANMELNGGQARFFLSTDQGQNWQEVSLEQTVTFASPVSDLRWRVLLSAHPDRRASPVIEAVRVSYDAQVVEVGPSIYLPMISRR